MWAHLDGTGILTASISTSDDHYFIEPSHRHFKQSHDFHMISYRGSDLKFNTTRWIVLVRGSYYSSLLHYNYHHNLYSNGSSYCGVGTISSLLPQPHSSHPSLSSPEGLRVLRQTTPLSKNSCPMHLVATHRFHQAYGRSGDVESTILFMVNKYDITWHHHSGQRLTFHDVVFQWPLRGFTLDWLFVYKLIVCLLCTLKCI